MAGRHDSEQDPLPSGRISLEIKWEGKDSKVLATIFLDAEDSLADINEKFMQQAPSSEFHYLCRGESVNTKFWHVFKAKYFYPCVILRAGEVHMPTIIVQHTDTTTAAAPDQVEQENNPYLKKFRKEKEKESEEEKKAIVQWVFTPPTGQALGVAYVPKPFVPPAAPLVIRQPTPAVRPPSVKQAGPRPSLMRRDPNRELAARAKSIFGAKS